MEIKLLAAGLAAQAHLPVLLNGRRQTEKRRCIYSENIIGSQLIGTIEEGSETHSGKPATVLGIEDCEIVTGHNHDR